MKKRIPIIMRNDHSDPGEECWLEYDEEDPVPSYFGNGPIVYVRLPDIPSGDHHVYINIGEVREISGDVSFALAEPRVFPLAPRRKD